MSASDCVVEGTIVFRDPKISKPCQTWYKLYGKLERPPLLVLHGGPGAGHDYMIPLVDVYRELGIPVLFYDQIGCGRSTHFPEKMGDDSFWNFDLFLNELENLVTHFELHRLGFYLLGQSWGGMLGASYASSRPAGLRKLILAGSPASIPLYIKGCRELLSKPPEAVRKTIEECEQKGDFESVEYEAASAVFYARHFCRLDPYPDPVQASFRNLKEDPAAYMTMQGPSEFTIIGNFKDWEGWREAQNIEVDVLLLNGKYDEATDACVEPWFRHISRIRWVTLEKSAHLSHYDERERFMELCAAFLRDCQ
ncbi:proline iminopeptidase [Xylariaceae sp. FL0594]|nr:proline iminopeptidase [Xylariaceae sp. FL0594]